MASILINGNLYITMEAIMSRLLQVDSVNDVIDIDGWWWIPQENEEPQKIFGRLTFHESGMRELLLFGAIKNQGECGSRCSVIWGEFDGGKRISLFNLTLSRYVRNESISATEKSFWTCLQIWIGDRWFLSSTTIRMHEYSYGINNLEVWHNKDCFSSKDESNHHIIMSYSCPAALLLYENDDIKILIEYHYSGPNSSIAQTKIGNEHTPRIVFYAKKDAIPFVDKAKLHGIDDLSNRIYNFLALLIGGSVIAFDHTGIIGFDIITVDELNKSKPPKCPEYTKSLRIPERIQYHYARTIVPYQLKKADPRHHILFPFSEIEEELLQKIIAGWLNLSDEITANAGSIIGFRNQINAFTCNTLPELIFAFEGLHRAIEPDLDTEAEQKKKALLEKCPAEVVHDLQRITMGWASLPMRLHKAFKTYHTVFPYIVGKKKEVIVELLRKARNMAAHAKSNDEIIDFGTIFQLARLLSLLMISIFMHQSGMPQEKIYECLSNTQEYTEIKKSLTDEIAFCKK